MLKLFAPNYRIGVSPNGLALARMPRWGKAAPQLLAERALPEGASLEMLAQTLRQLLDDASVRGGAAVFTVADEWARLWQAAPPQQAQRLADLEAAAAFRFHTLYGESPAAWKISAAWDAGKPFLAAALPRALLAVLEQAAAEHGLSVVEIAPHFVASWNQWRGAVASDAWFGVVHDGVLAIGVTAHGTVTQVRTVAVPDGAGHDWLVQHVAREALRLAMEKPASLALCGSVPSAWNRPDGSLPCVWLDAQTASAASPAVMLAGAGRAA